MMGRSLPEARLNSCVSEDVTVLSDSREKTWREFQSDYLNRKKRPGSRRLMAFAGITVLALTVAAVLYFSWETTAPETEPIARPDKKAQSASGGGSRIRKIDLKSIVSDLPLLNADANTFFIGDRENPLQITTSLDADIQAFLLEQIRQLKKKTRGKPRNIAFVAMEPDTGRIIGLAGYDLDNPEANPCYESRFPAASIFKIVTAAAAIETLNYTPTTPLYFNGNKYTLYKRQLKNTRNKYSYKISFAQAFAESINPVFGKISKNHVGKDRLETYARAFGFNERIDSEIQFDSGSITFTEEPYQWAELGCGFNRDTTISPVFGAMLASAVINSGKMPVPGIVERITDTQGKLLYQREGTVYNRAVTPRTAAGLVTLMKATVSSGTARKTFRGYSRHPVLSQLTIGGKTGSLYNKARTIKYDWFTGFGAEKNGSKKIAVSIMVGHGKYYGTKACRFGKMIFEQYFKETTDLARS